MDERVEPQGIEVWVAITDQALGAAYALGVDRVVLGDARRFPYRSAPASWDYLAVRFLACLAVSQATAPGDIGRTMRVGVRSRDVPVPYFPDHPEVWVSWSHSAGHVGVALSKAAVGFDLEPAERRPRPRRLRHGAGPMRGWTDWTKDEAQLKHAGAAVLADTTDTSPCPVRSATIPLGDRRVVVSVASRRLSQTAPMVHTAEPVCGWELTKLRFAMDQQAVAS